MGDLGNWLPEPPDFGSFYFDPNAPCHNPDVEGARDRLRTKLDDIRERLLASPHPLPPREKMSPIERLAVANTREEMEAVMKEIRQAKAERGR